MTEKVRITVLVENTAESPGLLAEHGLSLWIETGSQCILFDTGQGGALVNNADRLGISLSRVDTIILSHGHYDHTGGLADALGEPRHTPFEGSGRTAGRRGQDEGVVGAGGRKRSIRELFPDATGMVVGARTRNRRTRWATIKATANLASSERPETNVAGLNLLR